MTFDIAIDNLAQRTPLSWAKVPFRRLASLVETTNAMKTAPLLSLASTGVLYQREDFDGLGRQAPSDTTIERCWLTQPGDLVVNPMWLVGGGIGVSQVSGAVSPDYRVYRLDSQLYPRYIHYLLRSQPYRDQYKLYTRADTTFDRRVSKIDFHAMPILVPPLDEQRRIADFLDHKIERIDGLCTLRRLAHDAVMSRMVAELDFKIEQIGNTYGNLPFRRMIRSIEQGVSPQCDNMSATLQEWGVLKVSAVKDGLFLEKENKQLPESAEPERRFEIKHGDLLITRANTPQLVGAAAVAIEPRRKLMLCDKIFRVMTTADLMPEFLVLVSLSTKIRNICAEASHGTSQSMTNLKTQEIKGWPIPIAPAPVQRATVNELSAARQGTSALMNSIERQLDLLSERRQALITAAVTGAIDVTTAHGLE